MSAPGGGGAGAGEHFSVQFVGRFHPGRTWTGPAWRLEESARKLSVHASCISYTDQTPTKLCLLAITVEDIMWGWIIIAQESAVVQNCGNLSKNAPPRCSHINFSCDSHTFTCCWSYRLVNCCSELKILMIVGRARPVSPNIWVSLSNWSQH